MSTTIYIFMKYRRQLSQSYRQILLNNCGDGTGMQCKTCIVILHHNVFITVVGIQVNNCVVAKQKKERLHRTRGPWWSYIAHLTKQICIFTVEVSAKFTALGFLYKLYSTNHPHPPPSHPRPCFFTNLDDLNWILKEGHQRNISAKLYWNWSGGLKSFI